MTVITEGLVRKACSGNTRLERSPMYRSKYFNNNNYKLVTTKEEVYKLLTTKTERPTSTQLSPYTPLPAIGSRFLSGTTRKRELPIQNIPAHNHGSRKPKKEKHQKLERERTYDVLEPKFVKGPESVDGGKEDNSQTTQRKGHKKQKHQQDNPKDVNLETSSGAIFGPKCFARFDVDEFERPWTTEEKSKAPHQVGRTLSLNLERHVNPIERQAMAKQNKMEEDLSNALKRLKIYDKTVNNDEDDKPRLQTAYWFDL